MLNKNETSTPNLREESEMKKLSLKVLMLALGILIPFSVFAVADTTGEPQAFIRGVRPLGMGGAFTAISDDQNAFFYNPAGLTQRTGSQITILELPVSISEDVLNFYNFYLF